MRDMKLRGMILAAAALCFLLMPDGIPFLFAACGSPGTIGSVQNPAASRCEGCVGGGKTIYGADNCIVAWVGSRCEMSATVDIDFHEDETNCTVRFKTFCGPSNCTTSAGIGSNGTHSFTARCVNYNDLMEIKLGYPLDCTACGPSECFVGQGTCVSS